MVLFEQLALGNLTALGVCFVLLVLVNSIQWKKPSKLDVPLADEGIPLLGHTISFLQDACSLCFKMKDKYGSIYALKIGRTRFNILTDTVSAKILKSANVMEDLLNRFRTRYTEQLDDLLPDYKEQEIDLYTFCKSTMFNSSCNAVFGRDFPCEAMSKDYARFEQSISCFIKGYPRLIDRDGFQARENVHKYLKTYLADPTAVSRASQLVISHMNSFEQKPEVNDLDNKASYFMGILFASASNVVPAAFWIVAHTLATPGMKEKVRAIIAENYDADSDTFNWEPLFANENLKSLISETLRLHSNITNARLVSEDTEMVIGPNKEKKVVKKGEILLLVSDLVHWDPAVYPEPDKWIAERFLPENAGKLILAEKEWKTYVPWGGGLHMCSGRFFAMNEMVVQLTLMLWYFDITLHEEIPRAYIKERFGLGVAHPTKEMKATIVRREKSALRA